MAGLAGYFKGVIDKLRSKDADERPAKFFESTDLSRRASANFERYLKEFIETNETHGLPAERLSKQEWEQLNDELKGIGVFLIPMERNGGLYYWFSKSFRNRLPNFENALNEFLQTGKNTKFNTLLLNESELRLLNGELADKGIALVKRYVDGVVFYEFDKSLRGRASSKFEQYLEDFIQNGTRVGLPAWRLSEQEWKQLNDELKDTGVVLVPKKEGDRVGYWFAWRAEPVNATGGKGKADKFLSGKEDVENILIEEIRKKYPGISTITILEILRSKDSIDSDSVYQKIRYKQDGDYVDVSKQDFDRAFIYALTSAGNKDELFELYKMNKWNPDEYKQYKNRDSRSAKWPSNKNILMSGTQSWTWFRSVYGDGASRPVDDKNNPNGFHISLNVNVVDGLLKALDDILIEDGGRYIESYKFPKPSYVSGDNQINGYGEILRRHDPVTIYMYARNPQLEQKIVKAIAPFVRSNDGLIGEILGDGACINVETSRNDGPSVGEAIAMDVVEMICKYKDRL